MDFRNESHAVTTRRMGSDEPITAENLNKHIDRVFQDRYTCRAYDGGRTISEADWKTIIHAAWRSPSSMGMEPWSFVRLKDPQLRKDLLPYVWGAQERCEAAAEWVLLLGRAADDVKPDSEYVHDLIVNVQGFPEEKMPMRRKKIQEFIGDDAGTNWEPKIVEKWIQQQVYIALGNMMTVASMLGIDSTPIEGFNKEQVTKFLVERGIVDPEHFRVACFAAFGYQRQPGKTKVRRPVDQVYREV
ncbi:MAG: NAD(P)H-dependent oxidoreductase [Actinomycetaceae bacterium]|nr:NAD(P)H-dependent oxidoreductase [Actinomycetaceae bacterium]